MKTIDKKSFIFGFIAGIAFVFIVVAVSGDEETDKKSKQRVGRYVEVETIGVLIYMLDTTNGDFYAIDRMLGGLREGGWRKVAAIEDDHSKSLERLRSFPEAPSKKD